MGSTPTADIINVDFAAHREAHRLTAQERRDADRKFKKFATLPLERIAISLLRSDSRYQTPIVPSIVENIVKNFSQAAVNPPLVSRRADGTLWVIDGQHTVEGHLRLGQSDIECKVAEGLSLKDEAVLFLIRNDPASRRKLSKKQSFQARVEAHDPVAIAMDSIFKAGKWTLHGRSAMKITSVPIAEECYLLDKGRSFSLALADIDNAWPNRTGPVNLLMIKAVTFLHYNGSKLGRKIDQKRLRLALGFNLKQHKRNGQYPIINPAVFVGWVVEKFNNIAPNTRYMPRLLGVEILSVYNFGLPHAEKLGVEYLEGLYKGQ